MVPEGLEMPALAEVKRSLGMNDTETNLRLFLTTRKILYFKLKEDKQS